MNSGKKTAVRYVDKAKKAGGKRVCMRAMVAGEGAEGMARRGSIWYNRRYAARWRGDTATRGKKEYSDEKKTL